MLPLRPAPINGTFSTADKGKRFFLGYFPCDFKQEATNFRSWNSTFTFFSQSDFNYRAVLFKNYKLTNDFSIIIQRF